MKKNRTILVIVAGISIISIIIFSICNNSSNIEADNNDKVVHESKEEDEIISEKTDTNKNNELVKSNESNNNETNKNSYEEEIIQSEPKQPEGVEYNDFKGKLVNMGYQAHNDSSYEYLESERVLGSILIEDNIISIFIQNKTDTFNNVLKSTLELLLPNSFEDVYNEIIKENIDSKTMSLDNRTVSIDNDEKGIYVYILS